jgi:YidC/Oxa1 family membrane protein insertase
MFDRRTILALVIVGIILLLFPKYMELVKPKQPLAPAAPQPQAPAEPETTAVAPPPQVAVQAVSQAQEQPVRQEGVLYPDTSKPDPEYVAVKTPFYTMRIGSNAQTSEYVLNKYKRKDGVPLDLHFRGYKDLTEIGLLDFDLGAGNIRTIKNLRFLASKTNVDINSGLDSVVFVTGTTSGQQIILTYIFYADKYEFDVELRTQKLAIPETGEFAVTWIGGVPFTEGAPLDQIDRQPRRSLRVSDQVYAAAYALVGDELTTIRAQKKKENLSTTGLTRFAAVRSKYFIAGVVPAQPAAGVDLTGKPYGPQHEIQQFYDVSLRQPWGKEAAGRWRVYWGPIKYENLRAMGVGLEETMTWGWAIIKPFSRAILWGLTGLGSVITNYGVVIVLFSVIVKVVLWPLTRKSQVSMKKMAALQPEIQAIRAQHAKNPQAMNQAIMALYKERGVNPMSGCIPVLLQMPVFIALYQIFNTTIEFRQAPFMLWITDLSRPDAVYELPFSIPLYGTAVCILPLVMGVTQFFMSKRTTTDPNQKMMVYLMPIMMTLIFNGFPSGLTLYYTLFNVWTMLEQNLIKLPDFTPAVSVMEEKKKAKR